MLSLSLASVLFTTPPLLLLLKAPKHYKQARKKPVSLSLSVYTCTNSPDNSNAGLAFSPLPPLISIITWAVVINKWSRSQWFPPGRIKSNQKSFSPLNERPKNVVLFLTCISIFSSLPRIACLCTIKATCWALFHLKRSSSSYPIW